jgi:TolA-binding protein
MLPVAAVGQRSGAAAYTEDRIDQLQKSLRELAGRIEQLRNQNLQLQQQLEKMRDNYDSRLDRLEKGSAGKAASPRARPPKP